MSAALAPVRLAEALRAARQHDASDLHLCAGVPAAIRVDGVLEDLPGPVPQEDEIAGIAAALLDEDALARLDGRGDAGTAYRSEEAGSVRVHAYRTSAGIAFAMRLHAREVPPLESLHLPAVVASFADRPHGLVIVSGPTGSGKSTAMAALVDRINRLHAKHIVTIEDPIEYVHRGKRSFVTQREIGPDAASFASALTGTLRCDPDVIAIGEMRDAQTMHAALSAAETGHLVLATLHTGDAPQTVERIAGSFSGALQDQVRMQLAQTIAGVVCMRLVPRAAGTGRRCAAEVLLGNDAVRNLIREGKTHHLRGVIETSRQSGMQTLESHLSDLIARGEIAPDAAKAVSTRPADIRTGERAAG